MGRLSTYKLNLTQAQQKEKGFKYDFLLEEYVYKFPVYKHDGKPVLFCKLIINNEEDGEIVMNVYDCNNSVYALYYNEDKNNEVIPVIKVNIKKELNKLGAVKIR